MTDKNHELFGIDEKYRGHKARIKADEDLTPDAKWRKVRELDKEHAAARAEAERRIAERLEADAESAFKRAHGPERHHLSAEEETARELRLARIRAEITDAFEAGRQDPIRAYEQAVRAGDMERAEVIGKVGERHLDDHTRRGRLRRLVEENEPEEKKRARRRLAELEREKQTNDLGNALMRKAREGRMA